MFSRKKSISIKDIIHASFNPSKLQRLLKIATKHNCPETIYFVKEANTILEQLYHNKSVKMEVLEDLMENYMMEGAKFQLNLPKSVCEELRGVVDAKEGLNECLESIRDRILEEFLLNCRDEILEVL